VNRPSVEFRLPPERFATVTDEGEREYRPGIYQLSIGGGQPLANVPATSDFVAGQVVLAAKQ
jgi:hypothetical protein